MNFSETDLEQIEEKGLSLDEVNDQLRVFKNGLKPSKLYAAAKIGQGIKKLTDSEVQYALSFYSSCRDDLEILKFVPASGGATRMFKFLFEFLEEFDPRQESLDLFLKRTRNQDIEKFDKNKDKLAFIDGLNAQLFKSFPDYNNRSQGDALKCFVRCMLDGDKLDLAEIPKGLIKFHRYPDSIRTAFEEHLYEAGYYASSNNKALLHYTISNKHLELFQSHKKEILPVISKELGIEFEVTFSVQEPSTDTVAVSPDDIPFRNTDGSLLFRPSGHGALLHNLNKMDADLIFIKNIDNVVSSNHIEAIARNKCMLAGTLLQLQKRSHQYLQRLYDEEGITDIDIEQIQNFTRDSLNISASNFSEKTTKKEKIDWLKQVMNRPIRVCGMVKNEGQPGGGPFWVQDEEGNISLQIVESSQVDNSDPAQDKIFSSATHFNPVDLVCGIRDFRGRAFDLTQFVDHKAAFISEKTHLGKPLKALELPGLWNGSMANWITIFVEVPIITFNPVKTVNDLFGQMHQAMSR
ncbi:MAG: DUF4301 family protein [Bacteroidia bacterium]|nr:DUF4301 family protein [Bacteroidia bacterium]